LILNGMTSNIPHLRHRPLSATGAVNMRTMKMGSDAHAQNQVRHLRGQILATDGEKDSEGKPKEISWIEREKQAQKERALAKVVEQLFGKGLI